ncbi:MAG TPA: GNAT family N-acetyltransferase [Thermoleophilaceae bacterium]|nr:GNAT family N-acetyltransferase [Thermoleophilaceae bacterium]
MGLPLVTERLELRAFELGDLEALHAVNGDPQVTRFMKAYPTLEHTRRALEVHVREARAGNPAFWAVIERASGDLIGDAGVGRIDGTGPEFELGYSLGTAWWGRGYATEAAGAVRDYALGELKLGEVLALVLPGNAASIHVLEKIGMEQVGTRHSGGAEHLLYVATAR